MTALDPPGPLRRADYLILGGFCLVLFGYTLPADRVFTGHECVIPESSREMMADGDWIIPKCGGFPWLERPPLCHWITIGVARVFGHLDSNWVYRLAPITLAGLIVLLVARLSAGWYGRTIGLLSGLMLASMWEFYSFASDPEADIFLCAVVTGAIAFFIQLEFPASRGRKPPEETSRIFPVPSGGLRPRLALNEDRRFLGRRPWPVLAFFVLLGATNLVKGLLFGTLMVLVPIGAFLIWNADLGRIRRYVWLWGWLAFAAVALAWPVAAYLRCPDVMDVWYDDYVGRLNGDYISKPSWYYLTVLPWIMLPWTLPALLGLFTTASPALRERFAPARFLWCWAVLTPLIFSIPNGKHHHYMLQCLAPWSVLAALGGVRFWQAVVQRPWWARYPLLAGLATGLAGDAVLLLFRQRIPDRNSLLPWLLIACPALGLTGAWAISRRTGRVAIATLFALVALVYCVEYSAQTRYSIGYRDDLEFLRRVPAVAAPDRPLFVAFDQFRLETFGLLFYGDRRATLLPKLSYLLDQDIHDAEIYVTCRCRDAAQLARYGTAEPILVSDRTRWESSPADRRALFRLHFKPDLPRVQVQQPQESLRLPHSLHRLLLLPDRFISIP